MKILLGKNDDKAVFVKTLLKKHTKTKPNTEANHVFLTELLYAVEEIKLIKTGQLKGRPAEELLKELP
ncbi:hypothetical protein [Mucilaginibacter dorajii]|uniref:Uncharacterized protein n=1 Tax=Mucilaginibacter dorajii TaxID=692994 RepID=A0ABP7PC78_9SPHI|nr:hypothetical protein [Mucilaginibacter dorajii]MCS3734757.1 hypothetical protein [Mucilaginibacter dorajii]